MEYELDVDDLIMVSEESKGELLSVQVILSPPTGVILNGTPDEPDAGSTVADPLAVFTQLTDWPYWLMADALPAAMASPKLYANPAVAWGTTSAPVDAFTVAPVPAVVAFPPVSGAPLGVSDMVN